MSNIKDFDVEEYRAELESQDDETLFGEEELARLAETRMNALVEQYEEELDGMDLEELYGHDEWEGIRAAKIEERIEARLEALAHGGVTLVIIDTASGISAVTAAAIRCADLCLIPARPSVADIEASAATLKAVRAWQKPFAFVLNQTPVRGRRIDDATHALGGDNAREMSELIAQPLIATRNDHQDALAAGLAANAYVPAGKSAAEIAGLWRWAEARLNGGTLKREAFPEAALPVQLAPCATRDVEAAPSLPVRGDSLTPWDAGL